VVEAAKTDKNRGHLTSDRYPPTSLLTLNMKKLLTTHYPWLLPLVVLALGFWWLPKLLETPVDYNAEVKPLLNKKCLACHGGVKKSAGFSLLFQEEALAATESGHPAIIPGDAEGSEFIKRITHTNPELRMPPEGAPLSEDEVALLKKWIDQGAEFETHWAYQTIEQPEVPKPSTSRAEMGNPEGTATDWGYNGIDRFVLAKLQEKALRPASQAECATLARRLSLDLIGIPLPPEEVAAFCEDPSPQAYEQLVEKLLASPRFGEKWASHWLDLARYADTKGYEKDQARSIWRYRDYVIRAFNEDKPFDRFTVEQLAGDLLPNPTDEQLVATGFHRNTMNNDEGGTDDEEFRVAAVLDRVNTTMDTWLGTTFACIQCHSHPYDPIKHEEYYRFMAFFNNTRDEDVPGEYPNLRFYEGADSIKIAKLKSWMVDQPQLWEQGSEHFADFVRVLEPKIHPHSFDSLTKGALLDNKFLAVENSGFARLKGVDLTNKTHLLFRYGTNHNPTPRSVSIRLGSPEGKEIALWEVKPGQQHHFYAFQAELLPLVPTQGKHDLFFVFEGEVEGYIASFEWLLFLEGLQPEAAGTHADSVVAYLRQLVDSEAERSPIMLENPAGFRRSTHVFERGNWLVHGDEVQPGVPEAMLAEGQPQPSDRLGLANWLVSPENPLTARVAVNRFWAQLFGSGLVTTLEDFGSQGDTPEHEALLDWLSWRFIHEHKWSVKSLLKEMVLAATYQQSSKVSPELLEADPANRYWARASRLRLSAEQVRDQALAVSGLLSTNMYGAGVMPPQPEGVWNVVYSGMKWETDTAANRYRRGIYTFWRRTSPYPSMISFDAPSREFCVTRRINTNTPLQALVTLNDPVFVEASISLALESFQEEPTATIRAAYQRAMGKPISPKKLEKLLQLYEESMAEFEEHPKEAEKLLRFPYAYDEPARAPEATEKYLRATDYPQQLAAHSLVASAIMNLDEFVTRE